MEQSRSTGKLVRPRQLDRLCSLRWRSQQRERELAGTSERLVGAETQRGRLSSSISLRDLRYAKPKFLDDAGDKRMVCLRWAVASSQRKSPAKRRGFLRWSNLDQ